MRQDSEPSVEEILESIKKVIARDNREMAGAQRRKLAAGDRRAEAVPAEEVLELDAEAELADDDEGDGDGDDRGDSGEPPLIAEEARASMRESLTALAMLAQPGAAPQIVRSGETSLEGLAREMLRPMLAGWLDKNLPGMVERLVTAEIARIAGKKG